MNNKRIIFIIMALAVAFTSCKKEKESRTIITTIKEPTISKTPLTVGDTVIIKSFEWGDKVYSAHIERKANKDVTVKDEDGQKYYDNKVSMRIDGPDGVLFEKTFIKDDFISYINTNYIKPGHSALMGIAFNRADKGGNAVFMATVGSPDNMSDEFMSIQISVDKSGAMSLIKSQEISDEEMMTE